jgi:MoCo/4Fe-4S cofactor protein with predicted Tat translocation signal
MHDSRTGCDTTTTDAGMKFARAEYWRSEEDLEKTPEFRELMAREFGPNAQELASGDERRTFIKLLSNGGVFLVLYLLLSLVPLRNLHPAQLSHRDVGNILERGEKRASSHCPMAPRWDCSRLVGCLSTAL